MHRAFEDKPFGRTNTYGKLLNNALIDACDGGGCASDAYQQIVKNMQKFFFISIHKPPASIKFAPIKHVLAVMVEPFKFSPA